MSRLILIFAALVAILVALTGCGGSGDGAESFSASAYEGNYSTPFDRATGNLTITVAANGQLTVVIADSAEGNFVGTGVTNHVGGFFITCQGKNNKTVSVNGTLRGSGLGRTAAGTVAGSITLAYTASFTSAPDAALWTNHYEGLWQSGAESNNWFCDVSASGTVTGLLLVSSGENVTLAGNVYSNGSVRLTGAGNGKSYVMEGALRLSPPSHVLGAGLFKVTSQGTTTVGDWSGHDAEGG